MWSLREGPGLWALGRQALESRCGRGGPWSAIGGTGREGTWASMRSHPSRVDPDTLESIDQACTTRLCSLVSVLRQTTQVIFTLLTNYT